MVVFLWGAVEGKPSAKAFIASAGDCNPAHWAPARKPLGRTSTVRSVRPSDDMRLCTEGRIATLYQWSQVFSRLPSSPQDWPAPRAGFFFSGAKFVWPNRTGGRSSAIAVGRNGSTKLILSKYFNILQTREHPKRINDGSPAGGGRASGISALGSYATRRHPVLWTLWRAGILPAAYAAQRKSRLEACAPGLSSRPSL